MSEPFTAPFVAVGVDGSRAAVRAAVWATDEALSRDIPLRLVRVIDDGRPDPLSSDPLAAAVDAVLACDRGVRVQTETLTGEPAAALLAACGGAVMICVGAAGLKHAGEHRIGSTATALAAAAHCPVAVVRGSQARGGWITAELDETPDSAAVLQTAVAQARLRGAPLKVLGSWRSRYTDSHDPAAVSDGNRMVHAQLDRRLSEWRSRYPDLDVEPVAVHGGMLDYLSAHAASIQLVVVGARNTDAVAQLLGPSGLAVLHDTDCSVLVVDRQRLL